MRFVDLGDGLFQISTPFGAGSVHLYLVVAARTILIDAGVAGTPRNVLVPALHDLGLSLEDVDLVINTHAHVDHRGGLNELQQAGADIAASRVEIPGIESNKVALDAVDKIYTRLACASAAKDRGIQLTGLLGRPAPVDVVLDAGHTIVGGPDVHLDVIETPGHTAGSISLLWRERSGLFTGDAIGGQIGTGKLPIVEAADRVDLGLDRVESVAPETLWMAHDASFIESSFDPVVVGKEEVDRVVSSTRNIHAQMLTTFRSVIAELPDASDAVLARAAAAQLTEIWNLDSDPRTGLPGPVIATYLSYLDHVRPHAAGLTEETY